MLVGNTPGIITDAIYNHEVCKDDYDISSSSMHIGTRDGRRVPSSGIICYVVRWVSTEVSEQVRSCWYRAQVIFSTLKMEAICSSETSADTQRTTRPYIPEDSTLYNHHCENLQSYRWQEFHIFSRVCFLHFWPNYFIATGRKVRRGERNKHHRTHCHAYLPEFIKVHTTIR
jgi:hypothetical protein